MIASLNIRGCAPLDDPAMGADLLPLCGTVNIRDGRGDFDDRFQCLGTAAVAPAEIGETVGAVLARVRTAIRALAQAPERKRDEPDGYYTARVFRNSYARIPVDVSVNRRHIVKDPVGFDLYVYGILAAKPDLSPGHLAVRDTAEWRFIRSWPVETFAEVQNRFCYHYNCLERHTDLLTVAAVWLFMGGDAEGSKKEGFPGFPLEGVPLIPGHPNVFCVPVVPNVSCVPVVSPDTQKFVDVQTLTARLCRFPNGTPALKVFYKTPGDLSSRKTIKTGYLWRGMSQDRLQAFLFTHGALPTYAQALRAIGVPGPRAALDPGENVSTVSGFGGEFR